MRTKSCNRLLEAEHDPVFDAAEFEREESALRTELVLAQYARLQSRDSAILLVVEGVEGAGKGSTVNLLHDWMDPRHIETLAYGKSTPQQLAHPFMWRYWQQLPPRGNIGVVFGSWHTALFEAVLAQMPEHKLHAFAREINQFEAMLVADRVQFVKLWFHLSREAHIARCEHLLADPDTAWRVSAEDRRVAGDFLRLRQAAETVLRLTDTPVAPWKIVPSADQNMRIVRTARELLQALTHTRSSRAKAQRSRALGEHAGNDAGNQVGEPVGNDAGNQVGDPHYFARLDYARKLGKSEYEDQLQHWQGRLARLVRSPAFAQRALVLVFEGDDAAGKGGAIRRVTHALDVRQYHIVPVSAPTDEERARPYLWRFWRYVPALGRITIYDRSWYGRVLVERVENLTPAHDIERAYDEINAFEAQLTRADVVVVKMLLAISKDEQLQRFEDREKSVFKNFKLTPDDWRNRQKWDAYKAAASTMLARTNTLEAPWHVVATDNKRLARVTVLKAIVSALEASLNGQRHFAE